MGSLCTHKNCNLFCVFSQDSFRESCLFHFLPSPIDRSSRPEVFFKNGVLRNFAKFTGKHLCKCFPVNLAKSLRSLFLQNTSSGCFWLESQSSKRLVFSRIKISKKKIRKYSLLYNLVELVSLQNNSICNHSEIFPHIRSV